MIEYGIDYTWLGKARAKELGGYRRGGYKAYMKTKLFKDGIRKLLEIAKKKKTSILCMELDPKVLPPQLYLGTYRGEGC